MQVLGDFVTQNRFPSTEHCLMVKVTGVAGACPSCRWVSVGGGVGLANIEFLFRLNLTPSCNSVLSCLYSIEIKNNIQHTIMDMNLQ